MAMMMMMMEMIDGGSVIGAAPPVYVQPMSIQFTEAALEGNNVAGVKLLLFNKTAPTFCHHIALAAIPVRVPEPPQLAVPVLKI